MLWYRGTVFWGIKEWVLDKNLKGILSYFIYLFYKFIYWLKIYFFILITVTECDDGTYGYNCVNNCSRHCLNDYLCDKQTGHCDGGCDPGYTNSDCNKGKTTNQSMYTLL